MDIGLAQVSYVIASLLGKPKRGTFKAEEFLPPWLRPEPKQMTPEQMEAVLRGWAGANDLDADGRRPVPHQ